MTKNMFMEKRILVTGITGNLGKAAAKHFDETGWNVVGVSRGAGLDLTNWEATAQFIAGQSPFDIVFMTHGVQRKVMIKEFNKDDLANILDNNLTSAMVLSSALLKYNGLNPGALVVYSSSIQATQPRAGRGLYCVAKAGLEALGRSMAVELDEGRRAIALRLGQMTGQMKGIHFDEAEAKRISKKTPLPWVAFDDMARFVLNLYYQLSISGEVIEISSGHKFSVWPE